DCLAEERALDHPPNLEEIDETHLVEDEAVGKIVCNVFKVETLEVAPTPVQRFNDPHSLERAHRLADDASTHADALGDLDLRGELAAGLEAVFEYVLLDLLLDKLMAMRKMETFETTHVD